MLTLDIGRRLADNGRMYGAAVGVCEHAARGRSNSHLYHYANNNPLKYTDPDGRSGRNSSGKYLIARTEGVIRYEFNGEIKETHYVIFKDGDFSPQAFDGFFDASGNGIKISGNEDAHDNINITIYDEDGLSFTFDDSDSRNLNNHNDGKKRLANTLPKRLKNIFGLKEHYDISGKYKNINQEDSPLYPWWKEGIAATSNPEQWENTYNTEEQKAIRRAAGIEE